MEGCVFTKKDYQSELKPIWCPGCGDFGVLSCIYQALAAVGVPPHRLAFLSGIGCSSRIPGYTTAYGFNSVHGRSLPMAIGVKVANPELTVLAAGGDGDGFSIGGGHISHAVRRNPDITYIVMDNHIYGLTKGQAGPTTVPGTISVTTPYGLSETPVNPLLQVLASGCGFVAQGGTHDLKGLTKMIEEGIRYKGFAFIDVHSPCVTYGREEDQSKELKAKSELLADLNHDPSDKIAAYRIAEEYGKKLYCGVLYRKDGLTELATMHKQVQKNAKAAGDYPRDEVFKRNFLVH
ncbi:MAG: 2-oxoacid:ferredoxin oxidoreductase subunit beta [Deltaproteobacteria bacterium]|nr:2-oxoacid:ferredoxin oxidoreductase subunit beta [Deltaproteobacteria bacterium]